LTCTAPCTLVRRRAESTARAQRARDIGYWVVLCIGGRYGRYLLPVLVALLVLLAAGCGLRALAVLRTFLPGVHPSRPAQQQTLHPTSSISISPRGARTRTRRTRRTRPTTHYSLRPRLASNDSVRAVRTLRAQQRRALFLFSRPAAHQSQRPFPHPIPPITPLAPRY
jgi:hypothetical protein